MFVLIREAASLLVLSAFSATLIAYADVLRHAL